MGKNKSKLEKNVKRIPAGKMSEEKKLVAKSNPESYLSLKPTWNFSRIDRESKWCLSKCGSLFDEIIEKLMNFESMTWGEIKSKKKNNHMVEVSKLIKDARDRAEKLLLDDEIFSLRLDSTLRLYGMINNAGRFNLIWYDPIHEIYPCK
ncbi:MAG: hypothetical protein ACRCSK_07810 [Fusobacteriaceae bacterium]